MGCTVLSCRFRAGEKGCAVPPARFDAMGELKHFYLLLADKNRFALLPEIVRQFRLLELRDSGEGLCVFRCAREPDDESLRSLAKLLCARHSYCAVTFEIVQDDTLLGGLLPKSTA